MLQLIVKSSQSARVGPGLGTPSLLSVWAQVGLLDWIGKRCQVLLRVPFWQSTPLQVNPHSSSSSSSRHIAARFLVSACNCSAFWLFGASSSLLRNRKMKRVSLRYTGQCAQIQKQQKTHTITVRIIALPIQRSNKLPETCKLYNKAKIK